MFDPGFFAAFQFSLVYAIADWTVALVIAGFGIAGLVVDPPLRAGRLTRNLTAQQRVIAFRASGLLFFLLGTVYISHLFQVWIIDRL